MEPARLGPFGLLAELGSGGMGKVYRAEVLEAGHGLAAGAAVALKVIHPHLLESEEFVQRFLREAEIGCAVRHDNVVRTHFASTVEHEGVGQQVLVMEYVEGQTLRDLLEELERVPEELCRHIGREVGRALGAVHAVGAVHRDVKPENVLITPAHVVKLMDLGVARLQDEALRLSQTGSFVGSLHYAAPEAFLGGGKQLDGRADLHALGLVLYELATGVNPYAQDAVADTLRCILHEDPRRMAELNPQLSPFFEEVVHGLLAKDPDARPAGAADLVATLEQGEASPWWATREHAIRAETQRPLRRVRVPRETALYGRDRDLARLRGLYEKVKAGEGQVLVLEGEAGIGKTRLLDEFVGQLRGEGEDPDFLFGSYPPGGGAAAVGAFSEAFREHFGAEGSAPWLPQTPVLVPAFDALLRGEPPPRGAEPLTMDSLGTAFVHATRNLAARRPVILLLDDLHFAPEEARSLFTVLALAVPGHRVLLVGTQRPGGHETWAANLARLEQTTRLALPRLGPQDLAALLQDAFRSDRLARELGVRIAEKSDGNPFFAFELIRGLREGQFITQREDGTWVTTQVVRDLQIPTSVVDLIQARFAALEDDERELLDVAACCGHEFDPLLVASVQGIGQIPAMRRLAGIEKRHRLVRSVGRRFAFDHHQVQESLYAAMPELLREPYHAAIGEELERRHGAGAADPATLEGALCVELCEHFLAGAAGERALRYLDAALTHLEGSYANDRALALADRALAAPGLLEGRERLDVLLRKNARLQLLGRRAEQQALLDEVRALAESGGERAALLKVEGALGGVALATGRGGEAREHFERAHELSVEVGDAAAQAVFTGNLGVVFVQQGAFEEARARYEAALALQQAAGDREREAAITVNLGNAWYFQGHHEQARACYERALELRRELGNRRGEANVMTNLGMLLASQGHHADARARYESALANFQEVGDRRAEARAVGNLGVLALQEGRYEEARERFERALAIHRETGDRAGEGLGLGNLGGVLLQLGLVDQAGEHSQRAFELAREVGDRRGEANWLHARGAVAEETGRPDDGASLYEEAVALRRAIGDRKGLAESLCALGGVEIERGRPDGAAAVLREALALAREVRLPGVEVEALCRLALLPEGDAAEAESAYAARREQLEHAEQMRASRLLWRATGARAHLEEARRLLEATLAKVPEEQRERMRRNLRLGREILGADAGPAGDVSPA